MTPLSALNARLVGAEQPPRNGVGVVLDCPCGGRPACVGPLYVPFINPVDGGEFLDISGHYQDGGANLESLTVLGEVVRLGGCGWRGWIQNGLVLEG